MRTVRTKIVLAMAVVCLMGVQAQAQFVPRASDEIRLMVAKQEFDEDAAGRPEAEQVDLLARQFKTTQQSIRSIRGGKESWGEIILRLILAEELQKEQPKVYGNLEEAVRPISDLRAARRPWREVAAELHLDLGPVIKETHSIREKLRAQAKTLGGQDGGAGTEDQGRRPTN